MVGPQQRTWFGLIFSDMTNTREWMDSRHCIIKVVNYFYRNQSRQQRSDNWYEKSSVYVYYYINQ